MADDTTVADALPPQATGDSVPGQAAAAAGPSDAQSTIEQSLYGDGAQGALQSLRDAAPPVRTSPPGPATGNGPVSAAIPPAVPPLGAGPIGTGGQMIMGALSGNPLAGMQANMSLQQVLMQRQMMQANMAQRAQTMAVNDFSFLDKLKTIPVQNRAALVQQYFAEQGRHVPPAMAALLSSQEVLTKMTGPEIEARLKTDPQFAQTYWYALDKPKEFLTLHDDVLKQHADTTKAINEAEASRYAPRTAAAGAQSAELGVKQKQMEIDSFYADQKKAIDVEARKAGLQPGTPQYTDYTTQRASAIDARAANEKTNAVNEANLQSKGLSPEQAKQHSQFQNISAFMQGGLNLLKDPRVAKDRGLLEGRLRNLAYATGVTQGPDEDLYQTFSNLGGVLSVMQFPVRSRAQQGLNWLREHTPKPGDQPALARHRMQVMWAVAADSDRLLLEEATKPASKLAPTQGPSLPGLVAGVTGQGSNWRDIANAYPGSNPSQPAP